MVPKGKWLCDACANPPPTDMVSSSAHTHPSLGNSQAQLLAARKNVVSNIGQNQQQQGAVRNKKKRKTLPYSERKDLVCCICQGGTCMMGTEYRPAFRYISSVANQPTAPRWIHLACAIWSLPETLSSLGLAMDWTSLTLSVDKGTQDDSSGDLELKWHQTLQGERQDTDKGYHVSCYLCADQSSMRNLTAVSASMPQEAPKSFLLHCMHPGGCNKRFHTLCGLTYPLEMPLQLEWSSFFRKKKDGAPQIDMEKLMKGVTSSCRSAKAPLLDATPLAPPVDTAINSNNKPTRRVLSAQWLCEEHTTSSYDGHKRFQDGKAEVKVSHAYPETEATVMWLYMCFMGYVVTCLLSRINSLSKHLVNRYGNMGPKCFPQKNSNKKNGNVLGKPKFHSKLSNTLD